MRERGYKVIFICPTNKLLTNYGEDSATFCEFININFNKDANMKKTPFDISPYNCFVFDQMYFTASSFELNKIMKLSVDNPNAIILATGDPNQLKIQNREYAVNQAGYTAYIEHCLNLCMSIMKKHVQDGSMRL
jgi:hypothetical protein